MSIERNSASRKRRNMDKDYVNYANVVAILAREMHE